MPPLRLTWLRRGDRPKCIVLCSGTTIPPKPKSGVHSSSLGRRRGRRFCSRPRPSGELQRGRPNASPGGSAPTLELRAKPGAVIDGCGQAGGAGPGTTAGGHADQREPLVRHATRGSKPQPVKHRTTASRREGPMNGQSTARRCPPPPTNETSASSPPATTPERTDRPDDGRSSDRAGRAARTATRQHRRDRSPSPGAM